MFQESLSGDDVPDDVVEGIIRNLGGRNEFLGLKRGHFEVGSIN